MDNIDDSKSSYKSILKTTSLFASVKVVTILVNVLKNKLVAVLLGTSGVGLLGIFTTTLNLINSVSDLGISKSSVRNVSVAVATNDKEKISKTIRVFNVLLFWLSILSAILTFIFSRQLSLYSFGNYDYSVSFAWLSIAVFLTSISTGQLAILQGMRHVKSLAKASTIGAFVGLFLSVPLFYFFGENGIIGSILASAAVALFFTYWFYKKIEINSVTISRKELKEEGKDMIKLGIAMMLVSFLVALSGFVLRSYINQKSGVDTVGLFQAGFTIITGYFGMIFTAMSTDYFPRLAAINEDNDRIESEVNQQSIIALILLGPLMVLLLFIMPLVIEILYSAKFNETTEYVNWAIFGVIFQAAGQTMGMILLAKNKSSVFVSFVLIFQMLFLGISIFFFNKFGMKGLGIAYSINMLLYMVVLQIIVKYLYSITFSKKFYKILLNIIIITIISFIAKDIEMPVIRYLVGIFLIIVSLLYSINLLKNILGISSIVGLIKGKFKNR